MYTISIWINSHPQVEQFHKELPPPPSQTKIIPNHLIFNVNHLDTPST